MSLATAGASRAQEVGYTGTVDMRSCAQRAKTEADLEACREAQKPDEVAVRGKPPPRSASDWEVEDDVISATPHETAADAIGVVPGVFVTDRGLAGRAPRLSLRGFDGTSGQDVELFLANIPLNQVSNVRAPGYADLRLVPPEVLRNLHVTHGPFDPRQGDYAVAGSMRMDVGLDSPGYWAKGTLGSFASRRLFLGFSPDDRHWKNSFAAFDTYSTDGPGEGRAGERSSFVGQLDWVSERQSWRGIIAIGSARFDFPGFLPRTEVEHGLYAYRALRPLGRDRAQQTHFGTEFVFDAGDGFITLGAFASKTKMGIHQNLTGYVLDPVNGDDAEQVNDASTLGMNVSYRHLVKLTSKRDTLDLGVYARTDSIDQSDVRLFSDGTKSATLVDATVSSTNLAAYLDAALYPFRRFVLRGGPRVDSLAFTVKDRTGNQGLERTSQGFHVGTKATADYVVVPGLHALASWGEGFRSPQARDLAEGERVPFATVRSVEAGVRYKQRKLLQMSLTGFQSWLSEDRVFDETRRAYAAAPPSSRTGGALAGTVMTERSQGTGGARVRPFVSTLSATYTRAVFTESAGAFASGDAVPYAPALVVRSDTSVGQKLGSIGAHAVTGRVGVGFEGAAGRTLPGGGEAGNVFVVDALASVAWRELELGVNGANLLGLRYYDAQYLYPAARQPGAPPTPQSFVLVAPPTSVFVTLQIHLKGLKLRGDDQEEAE